MELDPRFLRQKDLVNQEKIRKTTVCITGLGGLGSLVALELAYLGVENLILIDKDTVEIHNLNRQIFYGTNDIGKKKVFVAKKELEKRFPNLHIEVYDKDIKEIEKINCDVIFDCLDNWEDKFYLDELAHKLNIPLIHGSVREFKGQVYLHIPNKNTCLKELFKIRMERENNTVVSSCGLIASLMVQLFILYLHGKDIWKYLYLLREDKIEKIKVKIKNNDQDKSLY